MLIAFAALTPGLNVSSLNCFTASVAARLMFRGTLVSFIILISIIIA